jgi:hypothetical protein
MFPLWVLVSAATTCVGVHDGRFFFKYGPLSNTFVKNNPLRILLPNLTWRKAEKVPRVTSRHSTWRIKVSANQTGGRNIPLLALA